jgi:hypothetical protein
MSKVNGRGDLSQRQQYEQLRSELQLERTSFDSHWRELGEYFFPRRTRFQTSDRNKGDRRSQHIINSVPRMAARTLQSGMHSGLTSPARPWMRLTTPDPELAEFAPVKEWLHTVTQRMLTVFSRSNLYNGLPTLYGDMGVFATGALAILEDDKELIRAYSYPVGSYAVGLDERGVATTFVREYTMTVRQVVATFGYDRLRNDIDWSRLSRTVKNLWDRGTMEAPIEVVWIVTPRADAVEGSAIARKMPWASCWYEKGAEDGRFLRESGYRQFPVLVPRWDVTGEDTYGTSSPGMDALGDAKGLQMLERRKAKAIDKALDPPLIGPTSMKTQKTSLLSGDITYADIQEGRQGLRPIHEVAIEGIQHIGVELARHEDRVNKAFFADLFLMLSNRDAVTGGNPQMTAREVEERHAEKLVALGPVLERLNDELLDPLIDRTFAIMANAGVIPEAPEELDGLDLKVEYLSILSQAQKSVGVSGTDRFVSSTLQMAEAFPEVRHKLRVFQAVDDYADMLGVNPKLVRTDDEAEQLAAAERQAMAQQQQAENAQRFGSAAASLSKVRRGDGSMLDEVLDQAA